MIFTLRRLDLTKYVLCMEIDYVFVNGEVVVDKGENTGATPGRALRRGRS